MPRDAASADRLKASTKQVSDRDAPYEPSSAPGKLAASIIPHLFPPSSHI